MLQKLLQDHLLHLRLACLEIHQALFGLFDAAKNSVEAMDSTDSNADVDNVWLGDVMVDTAKEIVDDEDDFDLGMTFPSSDTNAIVPSVLAGVRVPSVPAEATASSSPTKGTDHEILGQEIVIGQQRNIDTIAAK